MDENFVLELVSAVDYMCDIEAYLREREADSLPCDIQYLKGKVSDENILNNINKLTNNFPITQYFYDGNIIGVNGKQLICKTNTTNLKLDLLYFCQSIIKHLDLIYCYNNLNLILQK